ncbi:MAG: lysoplasmalogenase [Anaerolineaceae bacterium]|nr:lysoplasmalogenase [Anaerolineaceae bacterium]
MDLNTMWLFSLSVIFALADWYAVEHNITWLRYSSKPLVIVTLVAWLLVQPIEFPLLFWFLLALLLSLIGDIWLLAPPRFFMAGLTSFLLAHCCYIIAFNHEKLPPANWQMILLILFFTGLGVFILPLLISNIRKKAGTRKLQGAILIYYLILSLMALSATSTIFRPEWERQTAAFVAAGGLLFFFSDFFLAFDRFVRPVKHGRLVVHVTYHLGQFGLILGVVWHLLIQGFI